MDKVSNDSGRLADLQVVLRDVFAMKASSTLHSREPVLRFIKHCQDPFPLKETILYDFLKGHGSKQAPTFGKSFLGSVALMQHVLEAKLESPVFSTRVSEAANLMFLEKRKLQQKPPLTVQHVKALEGILFGKVDSRLATNTVQAVSSLLSTLESDSAICRPAETWSVMSWIPRTELMGTWRPP